MLCSEFLRSITLKGGLGIVALSIGPEAEVAAAADLGQPAFSQGLPWADWLSREQQKRTIRGDRGRRGEFPQLRLREPGDL
jgi:hypothetical protein